MISSIPSLEKDEFTLGEHLGSGGFASVFAISLKDEARAWSISRTQHAEVDREYSTSPLLIRQTSLESIDTISTTTTSRSPSNEFAIKMLNQKTLDKDEKAKHAAHDMQNEVKILLQLGQHPNIVRVHAVSPNFWTNSNEPGESFIVMEKLSESLDESLQRWRKQEYGLTSVQAVLPRCFRSKQRMHMGQSRRIESVAIGLARAMEFLHSRDIIYRDLKPANVGLWIGEESEQQQQQPVVKLFDFGSAKQLTEGDSVGRVGTFRYMAPEVALKCPYDRKADVYSFGMVLWEICSLEKPYEKIKDDLDLSFSVLKSDTHPPLTPNYVASDNVRNLLSKCWKPEPRERPSFNKILQSLQKEVSGLEGKSSKKSKSSKK